MALLHVLYFTLFVSCVSCITSKCIRTWHCCMYYILHCLCAACRVSYITLFVCCVSCITFKCIRMWH